MTEILDVQPADPTRAVGSVTFTSSSAYGARSTDQTMPYEPPDFSLNALRGKIEGAAATAVRIQAMLTDLHISIHGSEPLDLSTLGKALKDQPQGKLEILNDEADGLFRKLALIESSLSQFASKI